MPGKLDPYKSYGAKLIGLFARLMFSSESHSLTDLARMLRCSKQTILRMVDDIRRAYGVEIEESVRERRKYFRKKRNGAVVLKFKTASALEVISWALSFRDGCSVRKPKWLIEEFEATLERISKKYS